MKNYITHDSFIELYNKDEEIFERIFGKCKLVNTFINKIQKESKNWKKFGYNEEQGRDKMIGDLFEIFAELFFKILGSDNRVGVYGYEVENFDDYGVDGFGKGIDDKPCTIQAKFRTDEEKELTIKDLHNFQGISYAKYGVDVNDSGNLIIFSTTGLHWITSERVLSGKSRIIDKEMMRTLLDSNIPFWNVVRDYVDSSVEEYY